jgi:DNA invertase Pin-like site-specific DNA recombinase
LREGDTVVVWKLDRLSRSLKDVLHIMEKIAKAGAGFRSITENIDTTTSAGRMMMQMVASFAEFERHDPGADLCRPCRSPGRGARWWATEEARCGEAQRNRRKRDLRT